MKLDFLVYFYNTKKTIWCQFYFFFLQYSSLTVSLCLFRLLIIRTEPGKL